MFFIAYIILFGSILTELIYNPRLDFTKDNQLLLLYNTDNTRNSKILIEL